MHGENINKKPKDSDRISAQPTVNTNFKHLSAGKISTAIVNAVDWSLIPPSRKARYEAVLVTNSSGTLDCKLQMMAVASKPRISNLHIIMRKKLTDNARCDTADHTMNLTQT